MTVGTDKDLAQHDFWAAWAADEPRNLRKLRDGIFYGVVHQIDEALIYTDWNKIQRMRELYASGAEYCADEPFLGEYEYGLARIAASVAGGRCSEGDYERTLTEIEAVLNLIRGINERRGKLGLPEMSSYLPRLSVLQQLATIKWFVGEEFRDSLLTPQELISTIEEIATGIADAIHNNTVPPSFDKQTLRDGLALGELEMCKVAARFHPEQLGHVVAQFNRRHGMHLTPETGHFRSQLTPEATSAYYWDFELAKVYLGGDYTTEDIHLCMELRAAAARNTFGDWPLGGLYRHWRRQALTMLKGAGQPC